MGTTFNGNGFAEHLKKVAAADPDVVVVVGDFVDESSGKADMETAARRWASWTRPMASISSSATMTRASTATALGATTGRI